MPCGCGKQSQGDNTKTKKPPCSCQKIAANISSCCRGGTQPPTPAQTSCYCKPIPPGNVEIAKTCKCDEGDDDLDLMMDDGDKKKEPPPPPPPEEKKDDKKAKKSKKGGKGNKTTKFRIRLSEEQLAATCLCDPCCCEICTCKPETLWKCTDPSKTEDCCVQLEGVSTCADAKGALKFQLILTPEQLAATCDCEGSCECENCPCKLKLKKCKITCLIRKKGKKTCKCVCFKSLDGDDGTGGGTGETEGEGETAEEEEEEDEDDDFLGDTKTSASPQVTCKCKYIRQAVQKIQEKRKPCGLPPPPRCCPR